MIFVRGINFLFPLYYNPNSKPQGNAENQGDCAEFNRGSFTKEKNEIYQKETTYGGETTTRTSEKKRRYRPGTVALREIRKYQSSTETLIPKLSFQRLVKEVMQNECLRRDITMKKIQSPALLALQCATEQYITELFSKSQIAAIHGKCITVQPNDVKIVLDFRGETTTMN